MQRQASVLASGSLVGHVLTLHAADSLAETYDEVLSCVLFSLC